MAVAQENPTKPIVALFLAFELSKKYWKLGFSIGFGQRPRERTINAGDLERLQCEIRLAKERFGLAEDTAVMSCYEIGRDGFWLHRYLRSVGVENLVVDQPVQLAGRCAEQVVIQGVGDAPTVRLTAGASGPGTEIRELTITGDASVPQSPMLGWQPMSNPRPII